MTTKVLLIGPLPPPIGGVSVLFKNLVSDISESGKVKTSVIDTNNVRGQGIKTIFRFACLALRIFNASRSADVVSLHCATSGLHIMGPLVGMITSSYNKPLIIRKFGGTDFEKYNPLRRTLIRWALKKAKVYLAETKYLVKIAQNQGLYHTQWYSNSRPMPAHGAPLKKDRCCRFVYLGQIRKKKGVYEIIEAGKRFGEGIIIDIYGTLDFDVRKEDFDGVDNVRYRGVVQPEKSIEVLHNYDALLLPTMFNEGYPGVILEAYSAGLPVISTRMGAINEIADDETGILIEGESVEELHAAMRRLIDDPCYYRRLCKGVYKKRLQFSSKYWANNFLEHCQKICGDNYRDYKNGI